MKRKSGDGANRVFIPFHSPIDVEEARLLLFDRRLSLQERSLDLQMIPGRR